MQSKIRKSAMQNGLIMGVIFSVNFIFSVSGTYLLGFLTNVITLVILWVMYKMAVKYRNNECEGTITYVNAYRYISSVFFYASLISAIVKYIYMKYIDANCAQWLFNQAVQAQQLFQLKGSTEEQDALQQVYTPINYAILFIAVNNMLGMVLGLIMAGFIKKDKKTLDSNSNLSTQL